MGDKTAHTYSMYIPHIVVQRIHTQIALYVKAVKNKKMPRTSNFLDDCQHDESLECSEVVQYQHGDSRQFLHLLWKA